MPLYERVERRAAFGDCRRRRRRDDELADLEFDGPQVHREDPFRTPVESR
jgi:hypothetical protein